MTDTTAPRTAAGRALLEGSIRNVVVALRAATAVPHSQEMLNATYGFFAEEIRAVEAEAANHEGLEDAHAALASALLWLDGDYRDKPRSEFNRGAWAATARKGLAALVAARPPEPAAPAVPEDGRSRLRDLAPGVEAEAIEPLLALVRAADVLAECIGIDDYYETVSWPVDADGNSSSDEADRAAHVFAERLRALPESVRVAARKP